jgi:uncharacterized protein YjbI with pentapeptide repeats
MSEETQKQSKKLTSKQKIGLGILFFLGIATLIFGLLQFLYNIRAPFASRGTGLTNFETTDQQNLDQLLSLQSKDTDHDGLSDFDEIYLYKTSPYLEDSDSDGYPDKQEVDSGNDPNCPAGKDCMALEGTSSGSTSSDLTNTDLTNTDLTNTNLTNTDLTNANIDLELLQGQATPEAIRQAMRQAGVSDEILNKLDDQTLMEIYQETLQETSIPSDLNINANLNDNTNIAANTNIDISGIDVSNLSADEMREILRQAGVEDTVLQSLDDETLRQIFEESVQ